MPFFKQVLGLQELIQQVSKRFATVFQELLNITLEREVNQTRLHTYQLTVLLRTFHLILFHSSVDKNLKENIFTFPDIEYMFLLFCQKFPPNFTP